MLSQLRRAIAGRPVYIHLDCDVLEPGIVPTDYRVPDGLTLDQLHAICQVLAKEQLVGMEIAEFENAWSESGGTATPDALIEALGPVFASLGKDRP